MSKKKEALQGQITEALRWDLRYKLPRVKPQWDKKLNDVAFEYLQYNKLINNNVYTINIVFVSLIDLEIRNDFFGPF